MATAPQPQLPLFYKDLLPLNGRDHGEFKVSTFDDASFLSNTHAIPLTVDEFVDAQRNYPIVFTAGENPLPIALMGLNEGVNVFIDSDSGKLESGVYVPAYIRRYPFILAKLTKENEDMSLCFDPQAGVIGKTNEGQPLFEELSQEDKDKIAKGEEVARTPTAYTNGVLEFCSRFEESGQRTKAFIDELKKHDLLRDGRMDITRNDMPEKPFTYTGFQMVNEEKLRELDTATVEALNKNGMLMLMHAQLFSMNVMRAVFERQSAQGKVPLPDAGTANGAA